MISYNQDTTMRELINYLLAGIFATVTFYQATAQTESRLALVIGNANYDEAPLANPVHDAVKVAETLRSLEFDVILDTNVASKRDFVALTREFGERRKSYDIAFVYYAGHGIQVGSENFMLPTKEVFESEYDVMDYGVSVQNILRYLNSVADKVNVLILDACRNNPFEHKWNTNRSLSSGSGLAKISPPTGSLIAFSTEAGKTAKDGTELNSVYCKSLCENLLKEDVSLDQVFRNVRAEVLALTNGDQRPIESSQLTGSTYILNPKSFEHTLQQIDSLLVEEKFLEAERIIDGYLRFHPNEYQFLTKMGHVNRLLGYNAQAFSFYNKALSIKDDHIEAITAAIWIGSTDEDLGILYCTDIETHGLTYHNKYAAKFPLNFSILLAKAREQMFSGDSLMCPDALHQLNALQLKLDSGILDTISIDIKDASSTIESNVKRMIENNIMYAYDCLNKPSEVVKYAQKIITTDPFDPWPFINLANAKRDMLFDTLPFIRVIDKLNYSDSVEVNSTEIEKIVQNTQ